MLINYNSFKRSIRNESKETNMFLALPLMLVAWVGCSKNNTEENKTDSLKISESEKKKDESIDKEADKLNKEKKNCLLKGRIAC